MSVEVVCLLLGFAALIKECLVLIGYVSGGKSFPKPLPKEEEKKYIALMEQGDEEARSKLIEHNLRLVAHIAKKYVNNAKVDSDDLISIGTIGLIKGVSTFDSSKNTGLASYTSRCVENEILMFLRSNKKTNNEVSLDDPIGKDREGNSIKLMDVLGVDDDSIVDKIQRDIHIKDLSELIEKKLTDREKMVLKMRFGLNNSNNMTQNEIAKVLGISRSYVSRIEKNAVAKLSKFLKQ